MKRYFASALAVAALAFSVPIVAQASRGATAVQAGNYAIDSSHTLVQFTVNHFGISDYFGTSPGATGTLTIDPKNIASAKLNVTVPVRSLSTTNATLDKELVSADWFDAATYPSLHFVSTKVTRTGANAALITGDLTMHGVTKPITLVATFDAAAVNPLSKAYTLGFKATGVIKRSQFGVSKYAPLVSDETKLTITSAFEKKAN
jgi:polyisoprenoid-binding protein YceI